MKPKFTDTHKFPHGYTGAHETNIAATIRREQARLKKIEDARIAAEAERVKQVVQPIGRRK